MDKCIKFLLGVLLLTSCSFGEVLAQDSSGLICTLKEKYGCAINDTCTVVSLINGMFYLTHKKRPTTIYAVSEWALTYTKRLDQ
jgi:hypothetical protein